MKILIVEDDLVQRRFLQRLLTKAGHEVVTTTDGQAAWEQLEQGQEQLRLVLTDWMMPNLDGPDLVQRIRGANWPHYTYIILLTSKDTKHNIVTGLQAGADDYLTKPFDIEELMARVAIGERILNLEARLSASLIRLEELATHDGLTGLLNRRALYGLARAELSRAVREAFPVSFILLDVDHFKQVNDRYGHLIGDQALCSLTRVLEQGKRAYDQVGRWGGEEFLLMLPTTDLAEAGLVAERLRAQIAAAEVPLPEGGTLSITASLGVSSTPLAGQEATLETLVQQADSALYRAKTSGRNQVCLFEHP